MIQRYQDPEEDDATSEEIAAEISKNRHRIDEQLSQLAESVSPQTLVNNAADKLTTKTVDETVDSLVSSFAKARAYVRKRPVATIALAIGIAALLCESSKSERNKAKEA